MCDALRRCLLSLLPAIHNAACVTEEIMTSCTKRRRMQALSELMERSVSQLLSVRREHNCSKLDVEELKHLWDITVVFIQVNFNVL